MSAPDEVKNSALEDLRGVVRIARAASTGVPGNAPRIERAGRAIAAVAELVEAAEISAQELEEHPLFLGHDAALVTVVAQRLRAALARVEGLSHV